MLKKIFISFVCIELIIVAIILVNLYKKNKEIANVFTVNNKYYRYIKIDGLLYYYELKDGLGKINDLTNLPYWLNQKPVYSINKDGLNSEKDYLVEKPKDTIRIVTLGDSFTFGLFLDTKNSWPQKLKELINNNCRNKIEVINIAINGYDARYEAERFILKGLKYNPDLVLWLLKDEDFQWLNEQMIPLESKYENKFFKGTDLSNTQSQQWKMVTNYSEIDYNNKISLNEIIKNGDKSLNIVANAFKGKVVLLNLPEYSTDKNIKLLLSNFVKAHKRWALYGNLPNILRLNGTFPESHPNQKGQQLIATDTFTYIKNDLINCKK